TWFARWVVAWIPERARSVPVVTVSGLPEFARKIPDNRQPDASARAAVLVNCGVSTLALRLRMCFRHVLHRPLSSSDIACVSASEGGWISDTGFMYPAATLRGAGPCLSNPAQVDTG